MRNLAYTVIGALFGVMLYKSEAISWFRIQEMFRFQSFHMYGVLFSAVAVGAIFVLLLKKLDARAITGEVVSIKGKPLSEVEHLFEDFHALVTSGPRSEVDASALGKLAVFGGVREFPMRVKCATLCWHTLRSALGGGEGVSTE